MLKLAFKNLWARRRVNGWLFVELIAVTFVGWLLIDPVAVEIWDSTRPVGYDSGSLVVINVAPMLSTSGEYRQEMADSASMMESYRRIIDIVASRPDIESVAAVPDGLYPEASDTYLQSLASPHDTLLVSLGCFYQGTPFFSTYGIRPLPSSPAAAELESASYSYGEDFIVSESVAERLYPGENAAGKVLLHDDGWNPRIVGVVSDVKLKSHIPDPSLAFIVQRREDEWNSCFAVVARVRPGVEPSDVASDLEWMANVAHGNLYAEKIQTYSDLIYSRLVQSGKISSRNIGISLVVFFLACLMLGVFGTFWLQTGRRSFEAGVMKAFGARPSYIVLSMVLEGVVMALITWAVGCTIYLQYAMKEGLADKMRNTFGMMPNDWASDFSTHFTVISAILLALVLIVVVAGIYIPARGISRVNPVDAIRNE